MKIKRVVLVIVVNGNDKILKNLENKNTKGYIQLDNNNNNNKLINIICRHVLSESHKNSNQNKHKKTLTK